MTYDPEMLTFASPFSKPPSLAAYLHQVVPHEFVLQCAKCGAHVSPEGVVKGRGTLFEQVQFQHTRTVRITPDGRFIHEGMTHYREELVQIEGTRKPVYAKVKKPVSSGCGGNMQLRPFTAWARRMVAENRLSFELPPLRDDGGDGSGLRPLKLTRRPSTQGHKIPL